MRRATLNKVAREAGVSKTTASLVLSGKADNVKIAKVTREQVREVARRLDYRPLRFMPSRLNGKTGLITVAGKGFHYPNALWLHSLALAAEKRDYTIVPKIVDPVRSDRLFTEVVADGVVLLNPDLVPENSSYIDDVPVVGAGFISSDDSVRSVTPDYGRQINELISGLYRYKKKAVGILLAGPGNHAGEIRLSTYRESYCNRFGIPENVEQLSSGCEKQDIIGACRRLTEKGANGIILETAEMAFEAFKTDAIRIMALNGVMFATCGYHPGFELLPERTLIYSREDIEEMSEEIMTILT